MSSFRFLHAADIHLDSPLLGLARYETAPVDKLRGATRQAFRNLVDLAIDEQVNFVLLVGDLFDGDWKDLSTGLFLCGELGRLKKQGIRVFGVQGNHDAAGKMTRSLPLPDNTFFFPTNKPGTQVLSDLGVALHGQGFKQQHVETNLAAAYPRANPALFNIGLLHTSLDSVEGHGTYAPCSLDDLRTKGYQYWALGHVHAPKVVSEDPWIVYPGCIQGRNIRETGPRGCSLVTVKDGRISVKHQDLDVIRWALLDLDLTGLETRGQVMDLVRSRLLRELSAADQKPLAARLRLTGSTRLAGELRARPERLDGELRALAAEIGADDLWLEKTINDLTSRQDLEAVLEQEGPLAGMLRSILTLPFNNDGVQGLDEVVAELKRKLLPEAGPDRGGPDLEKPEVLARIIQEARELLVGRLLEVKQ